MSSFSVIYELPCTRPSVFSEHCADFVVRLSYALWVMLLSVSLHQIEAIASLFMSLRIVGQMRQAVSGLLARLNHRDFSYPVAIVQLVKDLTSSYFGPKGPKLLSLPTGMGARKDNVDDSSSTMKSSLMMAEQSDKDNTKFGFTTR